MAGGDGDGDGRLAGVAMRPLRAEDVHEAGQVMYDAFSAESAATGVAPSFTLASSDAGRRLFGYFMSQPSCYLLAAFDATGKLLGAACIDVGERHNPHIPDSSIYAIQLHSFADTICLKSLLAFEERVVVCPASNAN